MIALETLSVLKDQVWIKMGMVQGQPESSRVKDTMQHLLPVVVSREVGRD